ncbi:MAG TPA: ABC transporter substrate-binding protein [Solirubrobacteraceae bacterium]|nr:ABC transporter substrate-binding protein [Solirubrobacteraceae bacterium]
MRIYGFMGSALSVCTAMALGACGSSSSNDAATSSGKQGGTATVLMGTAPDFLDPAEGYTTQSAEATWISYLGLLTYRHASGAAGGELIPALAKSLPTVSADGKTYTFQLRPGLVYSNGQPVKASDFKFAVKRSLALNWGGKSFFTGNIVGAGDFDKKKAKDISGITTDDASGKITVNLVAPYGGFPNVVAFPAAGLVPPSTPMTNQSNTPPPGVGAYQITAVTPNRTFTLVRNPKFAALNIPDIPKGNLDKIVVNIQSNTTTEAEQVLQNQADAFDAGDTVPPGLLSQIRAQAKDRFAELTAPSTYYFFLNTAIPPFNNLKARQAVNYAIDKRALQRLSSGALKPSCYFLPEGLVGHPTAPCPYGDPNSAPDLAKAKQLVAQSGTAGAQITVWGQQRSPRKEYVEYYTSVLNQIGYKATPKIVADSTYFPTIGNQKTNAQTGFGDWVEDFPNPSDFYLLLDAKSIQSTNNQNFSNVNDPRIQRELPKLNAIPATKLSSSAAQWQALDQYVANQAYEVVYGQETFPKFFSNRLDFGSAVFHPTYLDDFSSWKLK